MIKIRIKERSTIARIAARKLGSSHIAIVIGRTIHLHNTSTADFIKSKRWLIHELKHVDQFHQHGFFRFLWLYLKEHFENGYHGNRFEVEARIAEKDESLLKKYDISDYIKLYS